MRVKVFGPVARQLHAGRQRFDQIQHNRQVNIANIQATRGQLASDRQSGNFSGVAQDLSTLSGEIGNLGTRDSNLVAQRQTNLQLRAQMRHNLGWQ